MQSAEDRIGTHCIGFPVAMARTGLLVVAPRGRRIGTPSEGPDRIYADHNHSNQRLDQE